MDEIDSEIPALLEKRAVILNRADTGNGWHSCWWLAGCATIEKSPEIEIIDGDSDRCHQYPKAVADDESIVWHTGNSLGANVGSGNLTIVWLGKRKIGRELLTQHRNQLIFHRAINVLDEKAHNFLPDHR